MLLLLAFQRPARAAEPLRSFSRDSLKLDPIYFSPEVQRHASKKLFRFLENRKLIAAVLAFPVPFGWIGGHRVYLGTQPYVPVAYALSVGGCFGLLPLIDFVVIVSSDPEKIKSFENNPKLFMWNN